MKKLWVLAIVLCATACSVEETGFDTEEKELLIADAIYEINGCKVTTFNYGDAGKVEVRNDHDHLFITIIATGDLLLTQTSLHLAGDFSDFPTVGRGNLSPTKMEFQKNFEAGVYETTFTFSLDTLPDNLVIASYSVFSYSGVKFSSWAGDIAVKQGNWSYFEFIKNLHPVNAGADNYRSITVSEAKALPSWDEVRKLYANMLESGVDKNSGTYNPTIWELINMFNDPTRESLEGEYSTTYTLGEGECIDSVLLTINVIPDPL